MDVMKFGYDGILKTLEDLEEIIGKRGESRMGTYEKRVVMGVTDDGRSLLFANIEINEHNVLTVSFDEVVPFVANRFVIEDKLEDFLDNLDNEEKLEFLEFYDCKPSSLLEEHWKELVESDGINNAVQELFDTSLYGAYFEIPNRDGIVHFESSSCGQIDREDDLKPVSKDFSDFVFDIWNKNHMKVVDESFRDTIEIVTNVYTDMVGDIDDFVEVLLLNNALKF